MYTITQLNNVPILEADSSFASKNKRLFDTFGNKPFYFWFEYLNAYERYDLKNSFKSESGYKCHLILLETIKLILDKNNINYECKKYIAKNQKSFEKLKIVRFTDCPVDNLEIKVLELHLHYMKSALKRNLDHNLTKSDIRALLKRKTCYYTGETLTDENRSVDRLDNRKGYVKGNIVACTSKANSLKESLFESKQIPTKFLKKILELMEKGVIV